MIYLLAIVFAAAVYVDHLRRFDHETKILSHRYRLYEIRDYLRTAAMRGEVDSRHWVFQYLDSTIAKTIVNLPRLNIWQSLVGVWAYRNDEQMQRRARHLELELSKPQNAFYERAYTLYFAELMLFLFDRHISLRAVLRSVAATLALSEQFKRTAKRAVKVQTESPEASTLSDVCPV
jgi:hypothetical protein